MTAVLDYLRRFGEEQARVTFLVFDEGRKRKRNEQQRENPFTYMKAQRTTLEPSLEGKTRYTYSGRLAHKDKQHSGWFGS